MLNRLTVIGNLGDDPVLKYTPNGNAVCNLRLANNQSRKGLDGEWIEQTLWLNVELWNEAAERAAERLRKGHRVYAEGQLERRDYTTRDGREGTALELRFARVLSLEKIERDEAGEPVQAVATEPPVAQAQPRGALEREPVAAGAVDVDDIKF